MRLLSLAMGLLLCGICLAADEQGKWVQLFDGKSLDGWKIINCQVEVQDGAMFIKGGNGVIRPERTFKDFVIEYEWKALRKDKWDSGLYFRCTDPPSNYPWPRRWQVNLLKGQEGNLDGVKGATSKGLVKDGEWNQFKLSVIGKDAALEINGKPAWKVTDVITEPEGFICVQAEVPGGGQFLFRNIRIMEVEPK